MTRKSRVRRNQRSKRVQRNQNRNTKRLTKRGRRTNVRKNSKKVNSKRRKRRKTRKTRQNVIMKGGLWDSEPSIVLLQPADQYPVYYDLFAGAGSAPISTPFVSEKSYPGRTGTTPGFTLFTSMIQIPGIGRLVGGVPQGLPAGTAVFYSDPYSNRPATVAQIPPQQLREMKGDNSARVPLLITEDNAKILARHSEVTLPNTEFTTTMCGDRYLAFLPPQRNEVPLYLKVQDVVTKEVIWIYFLSKWVKSRLKITKDRGYRRRMFLLRPVSPQEHAWSGCGSGKETARLKDRAWKKYVDRKIKGIHWDLDDRNRTVTVSYETRGKTGPVNDVFRLLPQRNVKKSDYQETTRHVSTLLPIERLEGPEEFEEEEDQDWVAFKRNLTGLWREFMSEKPVTDIGPKGVSPPSGTQGGAVLGKVLTKVQAENLVPGELLLPTVMAEAVPPESGKLPVGGATGY